MLLLRLFFFDLKELVGISIFVGVHLATLGLLVLMGVKSPVDATSLMAALLQRLFPFLLRTC